MDWDDLLKKILASGKKLISRAQTRDGFPIPIAEKPGQLYFDERRFHKDDPFAKEYAARYGIKL